MKLSVVIPTFNEIKRLPKTFEEVKSYLAKNFDESEIIISDGGSNDGTREYIDSLVTDAGAVKVESVIDLKREGKGVGVKKGMLKASGEWVLFMDADNSTKIKEIEKLLVFTDEFEVVIGSRYAGIVAQVKQNFIRRFISRAGSAIIRSIVGMNIKDTQCGFKLFSKKSSDQVFGKLQTKGWGFDVEALLLAKKFGFKIKEVPVNWRDAEGSHLSPFSDSINSLREIIKAKWFIR